MLLMWANPLIWADSAGWTGWEVLTVCDEWKTDGTGDSAG